MKHYRFRGGKSPNAKYPLKHIKTIVALLSIGLYSITWLYIAYSTKQSIMEAIDYNNKNRPSISINYSDINMSGYPLAIRAEVNDMKFTIDSSEAAAFIASTIEHPDDPFPKLVHRQVYSTLEKPIVLSKSIFEKNLKITMPKEIVAKHSFEDQTSLNLIYKFNTSPQIVISKMNLDNKRGLLSQKLKWLSEIQDFTLSIPTYQLRELDGDSLMSESQGINFSIHSDATAPEIGYNVNYVDLGTRYTDEVANLIEPLMQTVYFQHLARTMPMQYEELGYVKKYTEAGEHKINIDATLQLQTEDYDNSGDIKIIAHLNRLDQTDDYGSLNGSAAVQALLNTNTHKLKFDNHGYFAVSLKEAWHNKWLSSIDRAFRNISSNQQVVVLQEKLKMFLPNMHNYQYVTLGYKFSYDGDTSLNSKAKLALDHFKVQTDQFAIAAKKGSDFGDDLRRLPLNFMIKLHNYPKVLHIAMDYLHGLIHTPGQNNKHNSAEKTIDDFASFLNEVKHKDSLCKANWHGQLKLVKEEWYLGNYRLSAIQSIVLAIMLKG